MSTEKMAALAALAALQTEFKDALAPHFREIVDQALDAGYRPRQILQVMRTIVWNDISEAIEKALAARKPKGGAQ